MPGTPRSYKFFFGLHLYLAGKYCENSKVPGAQHNVNPAQAITWLVIDVTIYGTLFSNNSPPFCQFLCNKILLKKISNSKGMHIEQNFELKAGPPRGEAGGHNDPGPMDFRGPMGFSGCMSYKRVHRNDTEKSACEAWRPFFLEINYFRLQYRLEFRCRAFFFFFFLIIHHNTDKNSAFSPSVLAFTKPEIRHTWAGPGPTFGSRRP